jgi:hypothetical protein
MTYPLAMRKHILDTKEPLERKWAQVKALRNKLRTNDIDALFKDYSM